MTADGTQQTIDLGDGPAPKPKPENGAALLPQVRTGTVDRQYVWLVSGPGHGQDDDRR